MPMPCITEQDVQPIAELTKALLDGTKNVPSSILFNSLISAYFSAAVDRGFVADVPAALRAAADKVEKDMKGILAAKALIDAGTATAH